MITFTVFETNNKLKPFHSLGSRFATSTLQPESAFLLLNGLCRRKVQDRQMTPCQGPFSALSLHAPESEATCQPCLPRHKRGQVLMKEHQRRNMLHHCETNGKLDHQTKSNSFISSPPPKAKEVAKSPPMDPVLFTFVHLKV